MTNDKEIRKKLLRDDLRNFNSSIAITGNALMKLGKLV